MEPAGEGRMHAIEGMRCLLISLRRIAGAHVLGGGLHTDCPSSNPFILPASTVLLLRRRRSGEKYIPIPFPGTGVYAEQRCHDGILQSLTGSLSNA